MLNKFSYIWLLLLVICCWHCMAWHKGDRSRGSASSSSSSEDSSSPSEDCLPCKKRPTCSDHKRNQRETDIDCGGPKCKKCSNRKICRVDCDCISGFCKNNRCAPKCSTKPTKQTTVPIRTTTSSAVTSATTFEVTSIASSAEPPTTASEQPTTMTPDETSIATTEEPSTTSQLCDFECKNNGTCTSRNSCTCTSGFTGPTCEVESTGLCLDNETFGKEPILLVTFGNGTPQVSSSTPDHFNFTTTYEQQFTAPYVNDGQFSFVNIIDNRNERWHTDAKDHSGGSNGYMYLVNADFEPGQFYNGRVNDLCIGLRYELSVYLANIHKRLDFIKPNVLFEVRSADDNELLAQLSSGDVAETDNFSWEKYGMSFIARTSSVNLLMISNAPGGAGNDLAIDDIALRVCAHRGSGFCPSN